MAEDPHFIKIQIDNGIYTLSNKRNGRSFVWNVLAEIQKEDGNILGGLVYCRICKALLKYASNQTSNLNRHKCCRAEKEGESLKTVDDEDKNATIDACTEWIVEDCRPFSIINGTGFPKLAKFFINLGAKYGEHVDVNDLLPDATAISRNAQKQANDCSMEIKEEVLEMDDEFGSLAEEHSTLAEERSTTAPPATPSPSPLPSVKLQQNATEKNTLGNAYKAMDNMAKRTSNQPPIATDRFDTYGPMIGSLLRELDTKLPIARYELQMKIQQAVLNAHTKLYEQELSVSSLNK